MISLDNKEIEQTKWSPPSNRAWEKEVKVELHQNRELEICIRSRDGDLQILCGLVYLRLEDFFDANATTFCLPLEPQGILLAEMTYEIPRTERRQPKLKRGRKIFWSELAQSSFAMRLQKCVEKLVVSECMNTISVLKLMV